MEKPQKVPFSFTVGPIQLVMVVLLIVGAYMLGELKTKVDFLQKGTAQPTAQQPAQQGAQPAAPQVSLDTVKSAFKNSQVKFGDVNNKLLFVEVSDPSCPYCHIAAGKNAALNKQVGPQFTMVADGGTYVAPVPEMKKLVDAGKAAFAYIYDPGHGNGELGMKALYCAQEKGKFWDVHDLLFSADGYDLLNNKVKNDKANIQQLVDFLKPAIDSSFLKSCLDSGKYDGRLAQDVQLASSLGVSGTPGFYVNSTLFAGAYNWNDMQSAVSSAK
jgi:protein-disulfide isomerase